MPLHNEQCRVLMDGKIFSVAGFTNKPSPGRWAQVEWPDCDLEEKHEAATKTMFVLR